jgi:ribosomal protein S18 acetylase RimI-like enzyme
MERPAGLRLRPYAGEADIPDLVRIKNAEFEIDRIPAHVSVDGMRAEFGHPGDAFDAARDVTVALIGDEVVAWAQREWVDTTDSELREYRVDGNVHPRWRRQGIGTALLLENERLSRQMAATHATARARVFGSWSTDTQPGDTALLKANGYQPVRWFFDMVRRSMDRIPEIELPEGLEFRPVTPDLVRRVWDADVEAFQDHWGGFDASDESFQRDITSPTFDPSLWVIAFDGDEPAGGVINTIDVAENRALGMTRGWLRSVWTRRQWRRRGIARAAVARSLTLLRDCGMTSAGLGVDADNESGALGLYESVGFEVDFRSTAWRKPF